MRWKGWISKKPGYIVCWAVFYNWYLFASTWRSQFEATIVLLYYSAADKYFCTYCNSGLNKHKSLSWPKLLELMLFWVQFRFFFKWLCLINRPYQLYFCSLCRHLQKLIDIISGSRSCSLNFHQFALELNNFADQYGLLLKTWVVTQLK